MRVGLIGSMRAVRSRRLWTDFAAPNPYDGERENEVAENILGLSVRSGRLVRVRVHARLLDQEAGLTLYPQPPSFPNGRVREMYGPEDIDDDVWEDAKQRATDIESREWDDRTFLTVVEAIARASMAAKAAERGTCAAIALDIAEKNAGYSDGPGAMRVHNALTAPPPLTTPEEMEMDEAEPMFETQAEEALFNLFAKGFGTCRSNSGEYTVQFRFQHLEDAQKAYFDLCTAYHNLVKREQQNERHPAII